LNKFEIVDIVKKLD